MKKLLFLLSFVFLFACSKGGGPTLPPPPPPQPVVDYMFPSENVPVDQRIVKQGLPVPVVADWKNVVKNTTTVPVASENLNFTNDFRSFVQWQPGLKLVATVQGENFEFDLPFVDDPQRLEQLAIDFRNKYMYLLPMARRTIYVVNKTRWNVDWVIRWWNQVGIVRLIAGDGKPGIEIADGEGDGVDYRSEWLCRVSISPDNKYSPIVEVGILHETGHCLGFLHSPYRYSLMCQSDTATEPCIPIPSRVLLPLEIRALQLLYENVPY